MLAIEEETPKMRLWSWLVLGDDGAEQVVWTNSARSETTRDTVISIHENHSSRPEEITPMSTRQYFLEKFMSLTTANDRDKFRIHILSLREEQNEETSLSSALLFFIFDSISTKKDLFYDQVMQDSQRLDERVVTCVQCFSFTG